MHFPSLNQKETIENAKRVLDQYLAYHRLEQSLKLSIKSPIITDMPKAAPVGNSQEEKVTKKLELRHYSMYFCELIRDVISTMTNDDYKTILRLTYLNEDIPDLDIMQKLSIEKSQYYRCKNDALLVFAQIMPVFKDFHGDVVDMLVYQR